MADELDKSKGNNSAPPSADADHSDESESERPTVSPPFDPAAFARDVLQARPSPAAGTAAVVTLAHDPHTHATPPQGTAQQQAVVEMSRPSSPPNERRTTDASMPPPLTDEQTPDSLRSLAANRLPSHEMPRIDVGPKRPESFSSMNAVDREWADLEVATRPPPADAPDEDPVIEVSHDASNSVTLDLDDVLLGERPTAQRKKLDSVSLEVSAPQEPSPFEERAPSAPPVAQPASSAPATKGPPGEREMNDRVSVGDYSGALEIAELILAEKPNDSSARACAESCRQVLRKMYSARIGPLDRVPVVAVARDQLRWLSIDHKAGFVLSLVDGVSTLEMIIDVSGMPELDTLRILSELAQQRIISLK